MPRPPRFTHPIRAVRQNLAAAEGRTITQTQFGRRIGVSGSYIQRIELGQLAPTDRVCLAIFNLTGVYPDSVKRKTGKPVMNYSRTDVTPDKIKQWKAAKKSEPFRATGLFGLKRAEISLVALAMAARGNRDCLESVLSSFEAWLKATADEFGLTKEYWREFEKRAEAWNKRTAAKGDALVVFPKANHHLIGSAHASAAEAAAKASIGRIPAAKLTPQALETELDG